MAYYLKEDLRQFWNQKTKTEAKKYLAAWIAKASASKVARLVKMAKTIQGHKFGLLSYYDHPISTSPLERTNNKMNRVDENFTS